MEHNFSNRINEIIKLSRSEAVRLSHNYIDVEHLLLAIIKQGDGMAVKILKNLDVDIITLNENIEDSLPSPDGTIPNVNIPFTKYTEQALQRSSVEAKLYRSPIIGSEHLLLAISSDNKTIASQILASMGANYTTIQQELKEILGGKKTSHDNFQLAEDTNFNLNNNTSNQTPSSKK